MDFVGRLGLYVKAASICCFIYGLIQTSDSYCSIKTACIAQLLCRLRCLSIYSR